eukprot:1408589-Rhodomonas_salina.2
MGFVEIGVVLRRRAEPEDICIEDPIVVRQAPVTPRASFRAARLLLKPPDHIVRRAGMCFGLTDLCRCQVMTQGNVSSMAVLVSATHSVSCVLPLNRGSNSALRWPLT